ncbi:hypothetical protein OGATHE_001992 [Ogataea polymorpha]|uniref:Uncharacterized protein n=1 Tax=Ogataea polymorpha TaxID=460523 RepID=A0A9P8PKZ6_9ASCO|nr:hypothetical protein OGATHE_001992 [Ogataea polymorpha]
MSDAITHPPRVSTCCHLQPIEPAPRLAKHADPAIGPWLRHNVVKRVQRVVLLELQVLVGQNSVRARAASHVDSQRRQPVSGIVRVSDCVSLDRHVRPVRNVFHKRADSDLTFPGFPGNPQMALENSTVAHGNVDVFELEDLVRKTGRVQNGNGLSFGSFDVEGHDEDYYQVIFFSTN